MPMVQVFAPDGTLGDIPYDKLHDAIGAGAKIASKVQAPDGTVGFVPADRRGEALKAGAKPVPLDLSDADGGKKGFWSHAGQSLKSMLPQPPATFQDALKQGAGASMGALAPLYNAGMESVAAGQRGHSLPYAATAGASTIAGVSPERMEQAANVGDTRGVLGEAAAPSAVTLGGAALGEAAGLRGTARDALFTPDGKPTPLGRALSHPTEAAIDYGLRKVVGAPDYRVKGDAVNIRQSPNFDPASYNAGRKGITLQDLVAEKAAKEGTGVNVFPEPRAAFPGENEGYMANVPRGSLENLALAGKPGAATQLQQLAQQPIIYAPRGAGIESPNMISLRDLLQPKEPQYLYRTRDVGETGVPSGNNDIGHLTSSLEQAKSWMARRNPGTPQEVIRVDANSLKPSQATVRQFSPDIDWYKLHHSIPESQVDVVVPHQEAVESE